VYNTAEHASQSVSQRVNSQRDGGSAHSEQVRPLVMISKQISGMPLLLLLLASVTACLPASLENQQCHQLLLLQCWPCRAVSQSAVDHFSCETPIHVRLACQPAGRRCASSV